MVAALFFVHPMIIGSLSAIALRANSASAGTMRGLCTMPGGGRVRLREVRALSKTKKKNLIARTPKQTMFDRMRTTVRGYMLRGLLVLVPLGITAYALVLCYRLTAANLAPLVARLKIPIPEYAVPYAVVAISVLLFFAVLYVIGVAAAVVVGRRFIGLGEAILRRIPLVKTIYAASKQVMELFEPKEDAKPAYQEAVIVDFPGPGIKTIAFVVGRTQIAGQGEYYRVFVPTTPNPTSGYFEMFR
ncbi:MAG: DUF502 domain-containing protein, partial [Candidatus Hydrogenedentes bacterium]|nr:DUF502 domain-containing protein [Candidatus Hydrogenedentota bacterium]